MSGGLALMEIFSSFGYAQFVTIPGLGTQGSAGSGSQRELLVGGYLQGNLQYQVNKRWDVMAGVQWRKFGSFWHKENQVTAGD